MFFKNSQELSVIIDNQVVNDFSMPYQSNHIIFNKYGWFEINIFFYNSKGRFLKFKKSIGQWHLNYFNQLELEIKSKKKKYFFKPWVEEGLFETNSKKHNIKLYSCKHLSNYGHLPHQELSDRELEEICKILVDE